MNNLTRLTNDEIIEKYLDGFRHSNASISTRKSCLNYFFDKKYFGFDGHISEIKKSTLIDYFNYLNQLKTISLGPKKMKWTFIKGLLEFCMEYYDDFLIAIPKHTIKWKPIHKEPNSNKDVVMTKKELKEILEYLKGYHYSYYLIFKTFADTGMRKGELIAIDYDKVNLKKRYIETKGKTGRKIYYISKDLSNHLNVYLEERKLKNVETKALFLSTWLKRYNLRAFNEFLKPRLDELGIKKNITCHTFRKSLNTFRKLMDCSKENRKLLINHKTKDVNVNSYVKLNYSEYLDLYDKWYPYSNLNL